MTDGNEFVLTEDKDGVFTNEQELLQYAVRVREVRDGARAQEEGKTCFFCGYRVFFVPGFAALVKGQIYSQAGIAEYRMSQLCEYCFDDAASSPEEKAIRDALLVELGFEKEEDLK